jgi:hypothetical protein
MHLIPHNSNTQVLEFGYCYDISEEAEDLSPYVMAQNVLCRGIPPPRYQQICLRPSTVSALWPTSRVAETTRVSTPRKADFNLG